MKTRFGEFVVDSDARQLLRGADEIHLSPKAFDLLCVLVAGRPNVVPKQDLFSRIWPATFVVEANLNVLVGELRRALADSVQAPRFIRTAHGVGYAFCGDAWDASERPSADADQPVRAWLEAGDRTHPLGSGNHTIGRDPRCAVRIDDESVSRRHARILVPATGRAIFEDLGSTNGTFVDGRRVKGERVLQDGDMLTVGSVTLRFREATDTLPVTKRVRRKTR